MRRDTSKHNFDNQGTVSQQDFDAADKKQTYNRETNEMNNRSTAVGTNWKSTYAQ